MSPTLVSVRYVIERTGFAGPTIYRMAREGRIPAVRVGRSIRFNVDAIDKWLAKLPKAST